MLSVRTIQFQTTLVIISKIGMQISRLMKSIPFSNAMENKTLTFLTWWKKMD